MPSLTGMLAGPSGTSVRRGSVAIPEGAHMMWHEAPALLGPVSPPRRCAGGPLHGGTEVWRALQAGEGLPAGAGEAGWRLRPRSCLSSGAGLGGEGGHGMCGRGSFSPRLQAQVGSGAVPGFNFLWDKAGVCWASQAGSTDTWLSPPPCGAVSDPPGQAGSTAAGGRDPPLPGRQCQKHPESWDISDRTHLRSSRFPESPWLTYLWPHL